MPPPPSRNVVYEGCLSGRTVIFIHHELSIASSLLTNFSLLDTTYEKEPCNMTHGSARRLYNRSYYFHAKAKVDNFRLVKNHSGRKNTSVSDVSYTLNRFFVSSSNIPCFIKCWTIIEIIISFSSWIAIFCKIRLITSRWADGLA